MTAPADLPPTQRAAPPTSPQPEARDFKPTRGVGWVMLIFGAACGSCAVYSLSGLDAFALQRGPIDTIVGIMLPGVGGLICLIVALTYLLNPVRCVSLDAAGISLRSGNESILVRWSNIESLEPARRIGRPIGIRLLDLDSVEIETRPVHPLSPVRWWGAVYRLTATLSALLVLRPSYLALWKLRDSRSLMGWSRRRLGYELFIMRGFSINTSHEEFLGAALPFWQRYGPPAGGGDTGG